MAEDRSSYHGWCFTINNPTPADGAALDKIKFRYLIAGNEVGKQGTPHMQCYIYFHHAKTFSAVQKLLGGRAHIEAAKGSPAQNRVYCSKDGDFREWGELPRQGKRKDIDDIKELMNAGASQRQCIEAARSYQCAKHVQLLFSIKKPKLEFVKKEVLWYWGPTGTGKSRRAIEVVKERGFEEDTWISGSTLQWFQFYMDEKAAIFDDLRFNSTEFSTLLRLLDGYPFSVPVKGSAVWWKPVLIIVTTPNHPKDWNNVAKGEDVDQLLRRITCIVEFKKKEEQKKNTEIVVVE